MAHFRFLTSLVILLVLLSGFISLLMSQGIMSIKKMLLLR
jgi:hypothetical protein